MEKEVRNTFDPNEEISMEKFQIIGLDEEPEVLARPRVSYWKDAWRRLKSNKIALVALIILLLLTFMVILVQILSEEIFLPESGRQAVYRC